jgi:outer membrane biogenesis lipoprotein LolB
MNKLRRALALVCVLAFVLLTGCAVEKQEKTAADFEEAVAKTGYTVYEDNTNYDAQGYRVTQAVVALSQDEENRVEFFQCEDEEAAGELYEYYGAEIAAACAEAEESEEKDFTGDNYQCHGAQCDQRYFYRVQVGSTLLWASGNGEGKKVISKVVLNLDY